MRSGPRSGCGWWRCCLERQGGRKSPVRKQLGDLFGLGLETVDAGAEVDDEDTVGGNVRGGLPVVVGMDQGRGTAIRGFGAMMGILVKDGLHAHGRSALLLVGGLGGGIDHANDATVVGLALVFGEVEHALFMGSRRTE